MNNQNMRVFVSHSHEDNDFCKRVVNSLADYGVDVWYDQNNLQHGSAITDEIGREIKQRPISIFILSPAAMHSGWVKLEARGIIEQGVHEPARMIVPITAEPLEPQDFDEGWLFVQGIKRIESEHSYQPLSVDESIEQLLWTLALKDRPVGEKDAFEMKAEDLIKQCRPYLAKQDYKNALALIDEAIKGDSSLFDAWYLKGEAHLGLAKARDMGNNSMAHESFKRSVFLAEASGKGKKAALLPTALYGEGRALMALIRYAEARENFKRAVAIDSSYAAAWEFLGEARFSLGHPRRALRAFDEAIHRDSLLGKAYYGKAGTLQSLRKFKQALDALEQTIALDINNSDAWRQKAQLLAMISRRFEEAEDAFHALLKLDAQTAENWKLLGDLYVQRPGKEPYESKALAAYESASKLDPDNKEVWRSISRLTAYKLDKKLLHTKADAELLRLSKY